MPLPEPPEQQAPAEEGPYSTAPHKYGIMGRLLGYKHQEEMKKWEKRTANLSEQIHDYATNPNSKWHREDVDKMVNELDKLTSSQKFPDVGKVIKGHLDQKEMQNDAANRLRMAQQRTPLGGQPKPDPQLDPGASAFAPGPAAASVPQLNDDHKQQLMPMVMDAMRQQQGGNPFQPAASPAATQGLQASPPPGLPTPPVPFGNGAGPAGPAPAPQPNPAAETATSSVKGTIGFGGPTAVTPASPAATPAHRSHFMTGAEQGREQGELASQSEMAQADAIQKRYGNDPRFKDLSGAPSLEFETGRRIPMMPTFQTAGIAMSKAGDLDRNNSPVEEGTPGKYVTYQGKTFFEPEPGSLRFEKVLNPDGTTSVHTVSRFTGRVGEANPALQSAPRVRMVRVDMGDGTIHHVGVTATGKIDSDDPRLVGINAAMLPTDKNVFKLITKTDGSTELQPVTESSGKVLPGSIPAAPRTPTAAAPGLPGQPVPPGQEAAPPGPGPVIVPPVAPLVARGSRGARIAGAAIPAGGRPMTPEQKVKMSEQAGQLNNTIGVIKGLQAKVPMLANLVTKGKIALQVDPHQGIIKSVVNTMMPVSDEEAEAAALWQQMTEGVMLMRIPMGGAGFKGKEGMDAIQSLKGNLGQSTKVMKLVLEGTLRDFKAQRDPMVEAGKTYGFKVDPEYDAGFRPQTAITAPPAAAAQGGFIIGHKYKNLTYLGGDPKSETSWKK